MSENKSDDFPWFRMLIAVIAASVTWKVLDVVESPLGWLATIAVVGAIITLVIMIYVGWPTIMVRDGVLIERRAIMRKNEMRVRDIKGVKLHTDDPDHPRPIFFDAKGEEIIIDADYTPTEIGFALKHLRAQRPDLPIPDFPIRQD